ncbi:phosphonate C-P lyase system protein PhnK [Plastoroseomonas arctica]|uniref:Phosphonate C-P lyase system protein PhnK n=1 Tax=Plastoroseomonas arctica TaxID=1509237 RepID=A0AAF1JWS0_9PROT|nr:phosphonate C-P lyase system protein PhnK [Plastoroseomonas arctica]MBR0654992.1 phosphonate C-P lyase system protein PhnK [Plastoroseomonas arctica]
MNALLEAQGLSLRFGRVRALDDVAIAIWPGEVLAVVGESGSGKSTLLRVLSGQQRPEAGIIRFDGTDIHEAGEAALRRLSRTDWGFVHQNPRDGLRMAISAGGNIGERLMSNGARHYGDIRAQAKDWLARVEIDPARIDELPRNFSGGMQQRLQIARTLVTRPRLVFMDEPTGGLDVSVQAKLLDMLRALARDLSLAIIIVTHDIAAARLLAHRIVVMRHGQVVEEGLTDRVLDDPQHPYTQLLVSSVLAA